MSLSENLWVAEIDFPELNLDCVDWNPRDC
jgi:hypothetical protein